MKTGCTCDHRAICHAYRTATKRNDGRCLALGCECEAVTDSREDVA